jgi:hypothetical protein
MSHEQLVDVALALYNALDTPLARNFRDKLKRGEWDFITGYRISPTDYSDAHSYRSDAVCTAFLQKLEDAPTTFDTRAECLKRWKLAEAVCFRTNLMLRDLLQGENPCTQHLDFLGAVRKKISRLMGRVPTTLDWRFGSGCTYQHKGIRCLIPDKLSKVPEMTVDAWIHLRDFGKTAWARALVGNTFPVEEVFDWEAEGSIDDLKLEDPKRLSRLMDEEFSIEVPRSFDMPIVRGNRWSSVSKTALTDRAIGVEPTFNLCVQLGIGRHLKGQCKLSGLLTESSEEIHRRLACKGSVDGTLATIDLSSASDTVAYELVKAVVPFGWFDLLESVRSPFTQLPDDKGQWWFLEKFSSMGNGYTFELETTIFASICRVVAERYQVRLIPGQNFSVYGDDIIVPTEIATECIAALRLCGFLINHEKSFTSGPFRESCGGDFFSGQDVRPVFVKENPVGPTDWMGLHNQLVRLDRFFDTTKAKKIAIAQIPRSYRVFGPQHLGDIVLHSEREKWTMRRIDGCLVIRTLQPDSWKYPLKRWGKHEVIASKLYGVFGDEIPARDSIIGHSVEWVALMG